jgi:hypothetical protein
MEATERDRTRNKAGKAGEHRAQLTLANTVVCTRKSLKANNVDIVALMTTN